MSCCICRVEVAKRESSYVKGFVNQNSLNEYFVFPDEIQSEYDIKEVIGEGNNSKVYRAVCKSTDEIVAIKVIILPAKPNSNLEIQKNSNLEINILKNIDNINCIHLISYYYKRQKYKNNIIKDVIFLITDYYNSSLFRAFSIKRSKYINNLEMIKKFSYQLFRGLSYLHNTVGIAHCDIKPSNLLFNEEDNILRICDFGNAVLLKKNSTNQLNFFSYSMIHSKFSNQKNQDFSESNNNNNNSDSNKNISDDDNEEEDLSVSPVKNDTYDFQPIQTTIQYRAPEILYDCQNVDPAAADIWSAGCVIAEILRGNGKKLFSTSKASNNTTFTMTTTKLQLNSSCSTIDQLTEIISVLGQPTLNDFEKHEHAAIIISAKKTKSLEKMLPRNTPKDLLALLKKILIYCPEQRPTADECLQSPYFNDIVENPIK